jgi:hypothetical protein
MSILFHCGNRMDGSGATLLSSSPNHSPGDPIYPVSTEIRLGDDRLPLPSGHPLSWGLLTFDTLLAGSRYTDSP